MYMYNVYQGEGGFIGFIEFNNKSCGTILLNINTLNTFHLVTLSL